MAVRVKFDVEGIMRRVRSGMAKGVSEVASRVNDEIKETISYPGKGKRYWITPVPGAKSRLSPNPGSLPGDPPARQTGNLRRWWQEAAVRPRIFADFVVLRVGTPLKYAGWLERGTRNMKPRPYVKRSIVAVRDYDHPTAREIMAAHLRKAIAPYGGSGVIRGR